MQSGCQNPIACENAKPGNPQTEWDVTGVGDPDIQGFAANFSVNKGETVDFRVKTTSGSYVLNIYRLGYYGGLGARKVATVTPSVLLPQAQPGCLNDFATGLIDCGNWASSAFWTVPSTAVSGVYIAKLQRSDTTGASHVIFVVRDDSSASSLLFQTSDTTWQAYNHYGGNNLYIGSPVGRAYKVSYNRPLWTRVYNTPTNLFSAEYPMIRFLEANGYNVSYTSGVDSDRRGAEILEHKVFLSVGHDEYWSATQRANVEAARNAGVHLAFFSGNEIFWKTRWENSIAPGGAPYKTLVSYKETHADAKIDPTAAWTGTWRDPRFSPPADGGRPENALTGQLFMVNGYRGDTITVPSLYSRLRFWRNTAIASLAPGQTATLTPRTLGYEWDESPDNGFAPAGLVKLSSTTVDVSPLYLQDYGNTYGTGTATHSMSLYKRNGTLVFGAGTVQWSWGLDSTHDGGFEATDPSMQQATVNLLADMSVQPTTLRPGLVGASKSTDITAPISTVTFPANGSTWESGDPVTIIGTATDAGGSVAGVEVSTDGGLTWRRAAGQGNWSYAWAAGAAGPVNIQSRAFDDSGNVEIGHGVGISITKTWSSLWNPTATPDVPSYLDAPVEVGVKFTADADGVIRGIRFYKGSLNTGAHVVSLWTSTGTLLARAQAASETPQGWQQVNFSAPVPIVGNATYVASYYSPSGYYSVSRSYFATALNNPPLHAPPDVASGGNGVFGYGLSPAFPTNAFQATNYWVDVAYKASPDATAPIISNVKATGVTSTGATISWTTHEAADTQVEYGTTTAYGSVTPLVTTRVLSHTQVLSGLAAGTTYHYRVKSRDAAGNLGVSLDAPFTTCPCPVSLWNDTATPAIPSYLDAPVEVGLKFRADVTGFIQGIRFYKGSLDTGVHIVSLWTTTGELLARAQATNETASGWQQANFGVAVPITANTTYVASYYSPLGWYALTRPGFATGYDNAPLHALADAAAGGNGIFGYGGSPVFPSSAFQATNYWVDVAFFPGDITALAISNVQAINPVNTGATINWTTSKAADSQVEYGTTSSFGSTTSLDANRVTSHTQTLSGLIPGTPYYYRVKSRDAAGTLATSATATFSTCPCPFTIWDDTDTPEVPSFSDAPAEVGVKFTSDAAGFIQGIRFYKGSFTAGVHTVSLWTSTGALLARAQATNETTSGWQQANFAVPVAISANTTYVASYFAPSGFSVSRSYFTVAFDNVPLHAQADAPLSGNGVFNYSSSPVFPTNAFQATNYWVDVAFTLPDTSGPAISNIQATGIGNTTATIGWTTDEVSDSQVEYGTTTQYGSSTTIAPSRVIAHTQALTGLASATTYHYRVKSRDASGNLTVSLDATFRTCPCGITTFSLWDSSTTPLITSFPDGSDVEVGVRFKSDVNGFIKAIRFYKGSRNTGVHTVSLWTSTGTLLARVRATSETASGWQQVNLAAPVAITANTTYVASYHTTSGYYSVSPLYFYKTYVKGSLQAPGSTTASVNGVFRYGSSPGFPTDSFLGTNYWVDVVASTTP